MRRGREMAAVLAVAATLAGCVTPPPPRYYTLDMKPSATAGPTTVNVVIGRIRESEALARREILVKKTPTQIEYYAADQWAASLGELVSQKLEAELESRPAADHRSLVISGEILDFGQVDVPGGAQAHIRLDIEVRPKEAGFYEDPLLKKTYEARLPAASSTPGDVVLALSRGMEQIAAEIAADLDEL